MDVFALGRRDRYRAVGGDGIEASDHCRQHSFENSTARVRRRYNSIEA